MKQLFGILLFVFGAIEAKKPKAKPNLLSLNANHVNLSLETAFVFDPKDTYYDVSLIRSLRGLLDSLQNAITSKARLRTMPKDNYGLSDFLYELGGHIIRYSDEDIKTGAATLQNVVEDYYPAGTVYHKIIYDPRMKAFIKNTLQDWANTDPKVLRAGLKAMYHGPTYEEVFVDLVQALNSLYDKSDSEILKKHAKKFEKFPSTEEKLQSNIDKALNFIVFDRYEMLNFSMRSLIVEELSKLSEYVIVAFKNRSIDPEFFLIRKRAHGGNLTLQDITAEDPLERNMQEFSGSERDEFPLNPGDSLEKITKASDEEKENGEANNDLPQEGQKHNDSLEKVTKTSDEEKENGEAKTDLPQDGQKEIVLNKAIEINVKKNDDDMKKNDDDMKKPKNDSENDIRRANEIETNDSVLTDTNN